MPPVKTGQPWMNVHRAALILAASIITASCSEKSAADREKNVNASKAPSEMVGESEMKAAEDGGESQPDKDDIEEDCARFVGSTKVISAQSAATDCPGCRAEGTAVLAFRGVKTDSVSCSGDTCTVVVTIRAVYNPGSGERFSGGLTAWIPPEQRNAYSSAHAPSGEQTYRVQITYKHRGATWRAVEFDRVRVE